MFTFIILYFLNLVLDYPLQGTFLAEYKCKNNYILFVHCAIWALKDTTHFKCILRKI